MLSDMARHDASVVGLRKAVSADTEMPEAVGTEPNNARSSGVGFARVLFVSMPISRFSPWSMSSTRNSCGEDQANRARGEGILPKSGIIETLGNAGKFGVLRGCYAARAWLPKIKVEAIASASWRDMSPSYSIIAARSS